MNVEERVRLATMIDCDGSIGFGRGKRQMWARTIVTNSVLSYLERTKKLLGFGSIIEIKHSKGHYGKKRNWQYVAGSLQGLTICLLVLDYLIIKKKKARAYIELYRKQLSSANPHNKARYLKNLKKYGVIWDGKAFVLSTEYR